nr:von Willebrand factor D and EGF domain-containing protein-like [Lytechinus pictus]
MDRAHSSVHTRIWNCGGISEQVSCNCGFVAKEDNDVISVDMCDGNVLETRAEVEFSSGAFIRADISDWGMSITVQAPSLDFNRTVGLCGTFDGNPDNEFHDKQGRDLDLAMRFGQANEFVELWRLRDGGMFNTIPLPVPYELRLPACSCLSPIVPPRGDLYPIQSLGCLGETSCRPRCTRFEDVYRRELVQSNDVTYVYSNLISNNPFGRRRKRSASDDRTKRQLNPPPGDTSLDQIALRDFFNLFDLDIPVGLFDDTGPVGPSVQSSYFFLPDHRPSDLRPLRATWPTPSGISYEQAREFCFQTVANTTLANACGESGLRTNMYIDDAVEMCLSDVQLTEDLTWASQTLPLVENQCEAAYVSNRTLWRPDVSSGNELGEIVPPEGVLRALNCPNDCNGHGVCTKQGCICEDRYEPPDCSWKDDAIPYIVRLENNGLCDRETQRCDTVRITAREYREGKTITCLFSLSKDGINDVSSVIYAQSIAIRINRKTVLSHCTRIWRLGRSMLMNSLGESPKLLLDANIVRFKLQYSIQRYPQFVSNHLLVNTDNEGDCTRMECGTDQVCQETINGGMCICPPGYQVNQDNSTLCEDVNECDLYGTCDQICKNTQGSYSCSCASGYTMVSEGRCRSDEDAKLLVANVDNLLQLNLDGSKVNETSLLAAMGTRAMDYNLKKNKICWVNFGNHAEQLKCADLTKMDNIEVKDLILDLTSK